MREPRRHHPSAQILGEGLAGGWGTGIDGGRFFPLAGVNSRVPRKIGKARQSGTVLVALTLASIGDQVPIAHIGLDQPRGP